MIRALPLAALALAGCGERAPGPVPTATPTTAASPRAIGTTSGLSGQTSALTGTISGFQVERTDIGTRVQLAADTLFDFDKATLNPAATDNLVRTADLVGQGGAGEVTVTGYTDAKGEDAYNLDLSRHRADAVIGWLKARPGLADRAFAAVGKGEADPIAPNARPDGSDDPDGRARNRRVVVDIPR